MTARAAFLLGLCLVLAALGLASAYALTFGEVQINQIVAHHGGTVAFFALAALAKLLGTSVTLSSEWRGLDPPTRLAATVDAPLAVVHGRKDRFVPAAAAHKLFAAAKGPRRLDLVRGMGHAYQQRAIAPIVAALEWAATGARRPSAATT